MRNELSIFRFLNKIYPLLVIIGLVTSYAAAKNLTHELNHREIKIPHYKHSTFLIESRCALKEINKKHC